MKERIIKKGTKITIKSYAKIKKTLNSSRNHKEGAIYFNSCMDYLCGCSFILKEDITITDNTFYINRKSTEESKFYWAWHIDWVKIDSFTKKINKLLKY